MRHAVIFSLAILCICGCAPSSNRTMANGISSPVPPQSMDYKKLLMGKWSGYTQFDKEHSSKHPSIEEFYEDGTMISCFDLPGEEGHKLVGNFTFMNDKKIRIKFESLPGDNFFYDLEYQGNDILIISKGDGKTDRYERVK